MSESSIAHRDLLPSAPATASAPGAAPRPAGALARRLGQTTPTALVVAALGTLAYWGHSADWTLPKFSVLIGRASAEPDDWCKEHNVPESQCIECNAGLVPAAADHGWCKRHGVSDCLLEHPEVAQLKTIPSVAPADLERAERALALRPRAENNSRCKLHARHIQFASAEALDKSGIDIALVGQRPVVEALVANGEVVYDQTQTASLASRVAGSVWRVEKQVGDRVRKGDVLALIDAVEVGRAKADFLQALVQQRLKQSIFARLQPLAEEGSVPARTFREAETARQEAEIRLLGAQQALVNLGFVVRTDELADLNPEQIAERIRLLGLPAELVDAADGEFTTSNLFPLRSPLDGVVISRKVVPGEVVDNSTAIFGVADVSRLWLTLDVRQEDAKYLALGQTVLFRSSDSRDEPEIRGLLSWISTAADDQTRTVKVRANLPNDDGRLRANSFGSGRIVLRDEPRAIVVPAEAVHWDGDCQVVFVRDKNFLQEGALKFFHVRKVRVGVKEDDHVEIIVGLWPGEVIASKNSVVLESQLLRANLGAGCGCADGH